MINLAAIPKPAICKNCKFVVILGGSFPDQKAQERGFCKRVCEALYNEERDYVMEKEAGR